MATTKSDVFKKTFALPRLIENNLDLFIGDVNEYLDLIKPDLSVKSKIEISIVCDGEGGDIDEVLGYIGFLDELREYYEIRIIGKVYGKAYSGHSMIWASCDEFYLGTFGEIGIHDVSVGIPDGLLSTKDVLKLYNDMVKNLNTMAVVYSNILTKMSVDEIMEMLFNTKTEFITYNKQQLLELGCWK